MQSPHRRTRLTALVGPLGTAVCNAQGPSPSNCRPEDIPGRHLQLLEYLRRCRSTWRSSSQKVRHCTRSSSLQVAGAQGTVGHPDSDAIPRRSGHLHTHHRRNKTVRSLALRNGRERSLRCLRMLGDQRLHPRSAGHDNRDHRSMLLNHLHARRRFHAHMYRHRRMEPHIHSAGHATQQRKSSLESPPALHRHRDHMTFHRSSRQLHHLRVPLLQPDQAFRTGRRAATPRRSVGQPTRPSKSCSRRCSRQGGVRTTKREGGGIWDNAP